MNAPDAFHRETTIPFPLPSPTEGAAAPVWTGTGFDLPGGEPSKILDFGVGASGWSDELTDLHEGSVGSDSFIDVASRRHSMGALRQALPPSGGVIMEVGVSGGHLLREMLAAFPQHTIIGADYTLGTLKALSRHMTGVPFLRFDLTRCPLPSGVLDAVVLINVLEHIDRHEEALAQVYRILKPGGCVIVEVPAGPRLFDFYDEHLMHFRRYRMSDLRRVGRAAGFQVELASHLGAMLYPPFWARKKLNRLRPPSDPSRRQELVVRSIQGAQAGGKLFSGLLRAEEAMRRSRVPLPFGIRCLASFRKPLAA